MYNNLPPAIGPYNGLGATTDYSDNPAVPNQCATEIISNELDYCSKSISDLIDRQLSMRERLFGAQPVGPSVASQKPLSAGSLASIGEKLETLKASISQALHNQIDLQKIG